MFAADDTIAHMVVKSAIDALILQNGKENCFYADKCSVLSLTRHEKPIKFSYITTSKTVINL